MSDLSSLGNSQAATDSVASAMFKQWLFSNITNTDEKGDKTPGGVQGLAANTHAGGAASPELASEIGAFGDTAIKAAQAANVPLGLVGAAIAAQPEGTDLLAVASSPDQKTGPMQISQNHWLHDVVPNLSSEDRRAIETLTGKKAEQLNMNDPTQNVVAGTFELKTLLNKNSQDVNKTVSDYVQNVLGLDPKSKDGEETLSLMLAYLLALHELERRQGVRPHANAGGHGGGGGHGNGGGNGGKSGNGDGSHAVGKSGGSNSAQHAATAASGGSHGGTAHETRSTKDTAPDSQATKGDGYAPGFKPETGKLNLQDKDMKQWEDEILTASKVSGMPPELIGAQVWQESRGNAKQADPNIDGTTDVGLMCISNSRWKNDVMPTLSAQEKADIKAATGVDASQLDMRNPLHNVIGGTFEVKSWLKEAGGNVSDIANGKWQTSGKDLATKMMNGYVSGNLDGHGPGEDKYSARNFYYANQILSGQNLTDNDSKLPGNLR